MALTTVSLPCKCRRQLFICSCRFSVILMASSPAVNAVDYKTYRGKKSKNGLRYWLVQVK